MALTVSSFDKHILEHACHFFWNNATAGADFMEACAFMLSPVGMRVERIKDFPFELSPYMAYLHPRTTRRILASKFWIISAERDQVQQFLQYESALPVKFHESYER